MRWKPCPSARYGWTSPREPSVIIVICTIGISSIPCKLGVVHSPDPPLPASSSNTLEKRKKDSLFPLCSLLKLFRAVVRTSLDAKNSSQRSPLHLMVGRRAFRSLYPSTHVLNKRLVSSDSSFIETLLRGYP